MNDDIAMMCRRPLLKFSCFYTAIGAASLLVAACATVPRGMDISDGLSARVDAIFARRGLGADALSVIDNILRHEAAVASPFAPPVVRELLARPLAAANAAALFDRAVPAALRRLADEVSAPPAAGEVPASLTGLLDTYVAELAEAQRVLRAAAKGARIDGPAMVQQLGHELPTAAGLRDIAATVDAAEIDRASTLFLDATARFIRALRAAGPALQFPSKAMRFDSAIGVIVIGTTGDDTHGPGAAVIVDPGGNDVYERAPVTDGAVSVIVDLGGDDRYRGSDLVVHGLSAIIDFSGDDRYTMAGPGLGAAIAGASLIVDFSGDDLYEAGLFGQGAAAFGVGAILDLRGNDTYRLRAGGQGFGMTGGVGLLWDRSGNDRYTAAGLADAYDRGGGVSMAQGAATGLRTMLGGGIGILRDDAGNDLYEAQMFAQGAGYYYGTGLLWDGAGDDRYRAVRYAQGAGVHEAVGVLRDESGNDRYELTFGVGQGMGLDLAVGVLFDGAGDDHYQSEAIAQGAATANGFGIVVDSGGADEWRMGSDRRSWGRAEWSRRLPTTGLLLYDPARAVFRREGKAVSPPLHAAEFGGPLGGEPVVHEAPEKPRCPEAASAGDTELSLTEALRRAEPGFAGGAADPEAYASARLTLTRRLRAGVAGLPREDFNVAWVLAHVLRCALAAATPGEAAAMWKDLEGALQSEPATSFAGAFAYALRERPAPAPQMQRILRALEAHPACSARAAALTLRSAISDDGADNSAGVAAAARAALRSSCWRLQAEGVHVLRRIGMAPDDAAPLPSFLRAGSIDETQ
jgi:hypothetical protein